MNMVEKVARAICASGGVDPNGRRFGDVGPVWINSVPQARAAIEAMMEPTMAMRKAGAFRYRLIDLGNGTSVTGMALSDDPINSYQKMITAALSEESTS